MVMVVFQSVFHVEIHQNDIFFYFFKIIFEISVSKRSKTQKENLKFFRKYSLH